MRCAHAFSPSAPASAAACSIACCAACDAACDAALLATFLGGCWNGTGRTDCHGGRGWRGGRRRGHGARGEAACIRQCLRQGVTPPVESVVSAPLLAGGSAAGRLGRAHACKGAKEGTAGAGAPCCVLLGARLASRARKTVKLLRTVRRRSRHLAPGDYTVDSRRLTTRRQSHVEELRKEARAKTTAEKARREEVKKRKEQNKAADLQAQKASSMLLMLAAISR